jgi:His-Xaa-Ser system radical SAM maturase HxsC
MIALRGIARDVRLNRILERRVWLVVGGPVVDSQRKQRAFLIENGKGDAPDGYGLYLGKESDPGDSCNFVGLPEELTYVSPGDVVSVSEDGRRIKVLWRHSSYQNSVLLTERCNHYCLMCSQPPKEVDDEWLLEDALELIRLLPPSTSDINFTGGEPTLYGDRLIQLLTLCGNLLPMAEVHVLSNGRRFSDQKFAQAWAGIRNPRMMVGIPIYGAEPSLHDYVVQSRGAFNETIRGILNLAELGQRIEIRVVLHKQTAGVIVEIAEFISRNIPFVEQVALMGLEMIGLARANLDDVWIDPYDYRDLLADAVVLLDRKRIRTLIYNHQLCLIDRDLWPFAIQSISDWKNEYHPECLRCSVLDRCGGFFFSAKHRLSEHIRALPAAESGSAKAMLSLQ